MRINKEKSNWPAENVKKVHQTNEYPPAKTKIEKATHNEMGIS